MAPAAADGVVSGDTARPLFYGLGHLLASITPGWNGASARADRLHGHRRRRQLRAASDINAARVVPCDKVQWTLFGLSLAGYNAIISFGIVGLLAAAMYARWRRGGRTPA